MSKTMVKEQWLVLTSTLNGECLVMFEDEQIRVSVPGDESASGCDLSEEQIIELVKEEFNVDIETEGMGVWEAGEAEFESVGFFKYSEKPN